MSENSYIDTLDRICVNGVCHCDWRLTLQDCVESRAMTIVHGINVGLSGITVIVGKIHRQSPFIAKLLIVFSYIGAVLLIHRVFIKGHRLFDRNITKGCFRPKPIDCMLLFIVIFNLCK